jgi:signal transduction histidine kinase
MVDLVAVARQTVEELQPTTTRHSLTLVAPSDAMVGQWDPGRVAQALTNLLSNAIKYSPDGGEVEVVLSHLDGEVEVSVSDRGIGIAQEDLPLLFQPYSRLYRERRAKGVGLGLYIVKGIVEAHGHLPIGAATRKRVLTGPRELLRCAIASRENGRFVLTAIRGRRYTPSIVPLDVRRGVTTTDGK